MSAFDPNPTDRRGASVSLRDRLGVDIGTSLSPDAGVEWAADNDVHYVDFCLDNTDLDPDAFDEERTAEIRSVCDRNDIHLGLHTLSAVNMAETSPIVSDAIDEYMRAYIDIADRVGAEWIIVHGGYHFTSDVEARIEAAIDRLRRAAEYAEGTDTRLLLENHNWEPDDAEVHYIPAELHECERYFSELPSEVGWAFNPPHAHLRPEGIPGFIDALDVDRCGEVRLNDNRGEAEEHLAPGEGTIDFEDMFERLEEDAGYTGHYSLAWGTLEDRLDGRDYFLDIAGD